jgi:hypothetical protein
MGKSRFTEEHIISAVVAAQAVRVMVGHLLRLAACRR